MIGIDIVEVSRVESLLKKKKFFERFFSQREQDFLNSKKLNKNSIAGLIAAKEAVLKAIGIGIDGQIPLNKIEILHDNSRPYLNTGLEEVYSLLDKLGMEYEDMNISHDGGLAIAVAIFKKKKPIKVDGEILAHLPKRPLKAHKGDFGKALLIGGRKGMTGSIVMAARASLKTGLGLVYLLVPEAIREIVEAKTLEEITISLDDDGKDEFGEFKEEDFFNLIGGFSSIGIGPGLGQGPYAEKILDMLINNYKGPLLIDADAINILSKNPGLLDKKKNIYISPHEMEFSRLSKFNLKDIKENRGLRAKDFIAKYDINLILKGKDSILINRENLYINPSGNPGMATAGSGDVLTGILTGLLAREDDFNMAKLGLYIHGLAGDIGAEEIGGDSLVASDIINNIGKAFRVLRYEQDKQVDN